jgi:hypothetical protein
VAVLLAHAPVADASAFDDAQKEQKQLYEAANAKLQGLFDQQTKNAAKAGEAAKQKVSARIARRQSGMAYSCACVLFYAQSRL